MVRGKLDGQTGVFQAGVEGGGDGRMAVGGGAEVGTIQLGQGVGAPGVPVGDGRFEGNGGAEGTHSVLQATDGEIGAPQVSAVRRLLAPA